MIHAPSPRPDAPQRPWLAAAGALALLLLLLPTASLRAQGGTFSDDFSGTSIDTSKWTPMSLTFSHAGSVSLASGVATISQDTSDARVADSRFGLMSNAVFGRNATFEATLSSFSGQNAIVRLQGRNGAFIEWAIDNNADTPLHVWRSYPDNDKNWNGGKGMAAPLTFGMVRQGDNLQFYTVAGGQKVTQTTEPAAGLGDAFRIFLYGFADSTTAWDSITATDAQPMGTITGTVTGPGAAGARVSVGDTLFQPVIADASGNFSIPVLAGKYTVTASALGSQPATAQATVTAGPPANVSLALTAGTDPPIYDNFDGPALDASKWKIVTVEGQGPPDLSFQTLNGDTDLVLSGGDILSWRRQGLMSTTAFDKKYSVVKFKLDPNPNGELWHPFVELWDEAGIPSWNTQPHVEVEFRSDINRLQFNGGRAPFVSQEPDQMMFYPFDTTDLPAVLSIVRTGNTFDFYIRGKSDTADHLAFTETTSNLTTNHRVAFYSFTPGDGSVMGHTVSTWDYVAASNPVQITPEAVSGTVTSGGAPVAGATVIATSGNRTFTAVADASGAFSLTLNPGDYSLTAVAYGYDRASATPVTVAAGGASGLALTVAKSPLFPPAVYDDFKGSGLDMSKWKTTSEEGTNNEGTVDVSNGQLTLTGAGGRWGVMTTSKFSAAASVAEVVVNSVDNFGPPGQNAILQLYTGDSGFNHFIEFGIETTDAATGRPLLHVWGPESGDFATPSPSDFPITLTTVRHGNDLDFFANHQWIHSVTTQRLTGDHSVFLYGYGTSVPHFGPFAAESGPAVAKGDINGDGKVDIKDATLSLQIAVGLLMPSDTQKAAADYNGDGAVDVKDATLILRAAVGL